MATILCSLMQATPGAISLSLTRSQSGARDNLFWLLPDCVYPLTTGYVDFNFAGVVLEEDFSMASLSRFPDTTITFKCMNCMFKPTNVGASPDLMMNWPALFTHLPSLGLLKIEASGLAGSLPTALPSNLETFSVSNNKLTGTIPEALFTTNSRIATYSLSFTASYNQLTGSLPANLFALGGTPIVAFSFDVSRNNLTGTLPTILATVNATGSAYVDVSLNKLSGGLPSRLFASPSPLSVVQFRVANNQLTDPIPTDLLSGTNTANLQLTASYNAISGTIPALLLGQSDMIQLVRVTFQFDGNKLSGNIPANLVSESRFSGSANLFLNFGSNNLTGTVPDNMLTFSGGIVPSLISLQFSNNQLTGPLPADFFANANFGSYSGITVQLYLNYNQLSGTLPPQLLNSSRVSYTDRKFASIQIAATYNAIEGSIPSNFISSAATGEDRIINIDISGNKLSGSLPASLLSVSMPVDNGGNPVKPFSGVFLLCSSNALSGSIPSDLLFAASWNTMNGLYLTLDSNNLNGSLPSPLLGGSYVASASATIWLQNNQLSGSIPDYFFLGNAGVSATVPGLSLDLNGNLLTGTIPSTIFASPIASDKFSSLALYLGNNQISGVLDHQTLAIAQVSTLVLDLSSNLLTDVDPLTFSNISTQLISITLTLSNNKLDAQLPNDFFSLYKPSGTSYSLLSFTAINASLSGAFPTGPVTRASTCTVDLGDNQMGSDLSLDAFILSTTLTSATLKVPNNAFNGALIIPTLGSSSKLIVFNLRAKSNAFSSLNMSTESLAYLRYLDVSNISTLAGTLPTALFSQTQNFGYLNASYTGLSGAFPQVGGSIDTALTNLDLRSTKIDFCSASTAMWVANALVSCALQDTNATSCPSLYPLACLSSVTTVPTTPSPVVDTSCPNATRPSEAFQCVNGVWTAFGDVSTPTLVVPAGATQTVINGNLGSSTIVLEGSGSTIIISGCANELVTLTIQLSPEELSRLTTKQLQTLLTYNGNDTACSNLSNVSITATLKSKTCKKVSAQKVASTGTLSVLFSVDSSRCKVWWIVLASVLGGLVVIGVVVVILLAIFVPSVRSFFRPYEKRKVSKGLN